MIRHMCKSKIHRATVTEANLDYVGSITIASDLMEAANLVPYERVQVVDINNGSRLETYVIPAPPRTGSICLNGAAARLVHAGDLIIIIAYAMVDEAELRTFQPRVVFVDEKNRITKIVDVEPPGTTHLQIVGE